MRGSTVGSRLFRPLSPQPAHSGTKGGADEPLLRACLRRVRSARSCFRNLFRRSPMSVPVTGCRPLEQIVNDSPGESSR